MAMKGFENGVLSILTNSVLAVGEKVGNIARAMGEGMQSDVAGVSVGAGHSEGFFASIGSAIREGLSRDQAPEIAPAREQAVQVAVAAPPRNEHHVDMHDLGNFSPPSFGGAVGGHSMGRG